MDIIGASVCLVESYGLSGAARNVVDRVRSASVRMAFGRISYARPQQARSYWGRPNGVRTATPEEPAGRGRAGVDPPPTFSSRSRNPSRVRGAIASWWWDEPAVAIPRGRIEGGSIRARRLGRNALDGGGVYAGAWGGQVPRGSFAGTVRAWG